MSNNRTTIQWVKAQIEKLNLITFDPEYHSEYKYNKGQLDVFQAIVRRLEETPSSTPAQDWEAALQNAEMKYYDTRRPVSNEGHSSIFKDGAEWAKQQLAAAHPAP